MPLYIPPINDTLPLALGPAKPRTTAHDSSPTKRPVPGKPHLFVLPDGRMSYEPPTPKDALTFTYYGQIDNFRVLVSDNLPRPPQPTSGVSAEEKLAILDLFGTLETGAPQYRLFGDPVDPVQVVETYARRCRHEV